MILKTPRLILRPWQPEDFKPFAAMNADPKVMEFFPATLAQEESDVLARKLQEQLEERGWGFWAVAVPGTADFIGFIGISPVPFTAPFTPTVEIAWRLSPQYWGQGYATEGAKAALQYGFEILKLEEIVAFTTVSNTKSRAVMRRLGMTHNPQDDFEHPKLTEGHPLRHHVLYRFSAKQWFQVKA